MVFLLISGIFCFFFMIGVQLFLGESFLENCIFILEPDEATKTEMEKAKIPFDGFKFTLISCMIPIFNVIYILYYLIIALTTDEESLIELRDAMRDIKNGKK